MRWKSSLLVGRIDYDNSVVISFLVTYADPCSSCYHPYGEPFRKTVQRPFWKTIGITIAIHMQVKTYLAMNCLAPCLHSLPSDPVSIFLPEVVFHDPVNASSMHAKVVTASPSMAITLQFLPLRVSTCRSSLRTRVRRTWIA